MVWCTLAVNVAVRVKVELKKKKKTEPGCEEESG